MNLLTSEHSPYLKSAAGQPVHWFPWGLQAFEKARQENKPILLDIGAVWCHWCHVMDMESYENDAIAAIINEKFVAVKVDRDERPDIDARYQAAVSAMSGQGGWPLTAFLMPDGRVFYGGTYFPPEDRHGRPGFPKVLEALSETFRHEPEKVLDNANRLSSFVADRLNASATPDDLTDSILETALSSISRSFDIRHGGFGGAPKFPHPSALEFLLASHDRTNEGWMIKTVEETLKAMAKGGIHDHLEGGFHRYSTDERWLVPHFEKMLYDNAPLLENYVHAFQATGIELFRDVAAGIIRFVDEILSETPDRGFFSSQDADVDFGDDGSYFTWTMGDAQLVMEKDEFDVLQAAYDIYERGEMHHDPSQNVLFLSKSPEEIAALLGRPVGAIQGLLKTGREKLLAARRRRKSPFVDRTIFASWNGMMISAYFTAFRAFADDHLALNATKALDRILLEHSRSDGLISHRAASLANEGFLDDQVQVARALLDAFEATGNSPYLARAEEIMQRTIDAFWDKGSGGFNDIPGNDHGLGVLSLPFKSVQDSPTAAGNSVAVLVMNRLFVLTQRPIFREYAEKTLRYFAGNMAEYGVFGASYFLALEQFLHPPVHVVVLTKNGDETGAAMYRRALQVSRYGTIVEKIDPGLKTRLPAALHGIEDFRLPVAYVCAARSCAPPSYDPTHLERTIKQFGRKPLAEPFTHSFDRQP